MRFQFVVVPVGALLIAAPRIGDAAQHSDRIDALRQIATDVGHATNAASVCREISWPRIKALTDQFSDLAKASGANGEEFSSIQQAYDQSAIEGQRTLSSKHIDCAAAVRDLVDLERAVTGASPTQVQTATAASPPSAAATTGAALPRHPGQRRER
jgi:phage-related tail protein